jgi:hypothetical protein
LRCQRTHLVLLSGPAEHVDVSGKPTPVHRTVHSVLREAHAAEQVARVVLFERALGPRVRHVVVRIERDVAGEVQVGGRGEVTHGAERHAGAELDPLKILLQDLPLLLRALQPRVQLEGPEVVFRR